MFQSKFYKMKFEIIRLKSVQSTNKFAMDFVEKYPAKNGLVFWADEQTAGRGYGDNTWESEKGKNLTCTLLIKPLDISPANQFAITQMVSVALQSLVEGITGRNDIRIKWPNDIYAGNKKLAGMLIQNTIKGQELAVSLIGIGLNINQEKFSRQLPNPVSIFQLTNQLSDREIILNKFLEIFQNEYDLSGTPFFLETINKKYVEKLYLFHQWAPYRAGDNYFKAKINGIGAFGHLILELENGEEKQYGFKEVEFITE